MPDAQKSTADLLAGHAQRIETWRDVERATRDADAERYEDFFTDFQTRVERRAYRANLKHTAGNRALEVGCGTGRTMDTLTSRKRVGLNLSFAELQVARRRLGPDVALVQASATDMPFRDGAFDTLLCAGVIHHIPGEDQRARVLREMRRVTTPSARVVIALHSYPLLVRRMFPRELVYHNLFWHRFTVRELRDLLRATLGRGRLHIEAICHIPRWRIGDRLGQFGVLLDRLLSRLPGLSRLSGIILVARLDRRPSLSS
jgi:ubiquinone/menaquinone biosynthesis C-methylase UbiE